jgi:hypothetical protein
VVVDDLWVLMQGKIGVREGNVSGREKGRETGRAGERAGGRAGGRGEVNEVSE